MFANRLSLPAFGLVALLCTVCTSVRDQDSLLADLPRTTVDVGAAEGLRVSVLLDGLNNPSGVSFKPSGELMVCDGGNGRVLMVGRDGAKPYLTGFDTEYWKVDAASGTKRFQLGPLSAVWLTNDLLCVADGGKLDGADRLGYFTGPGTAADGKYTPGIAPTSDDPADKGEGNPTGLAVGPDGDTIYAAGQGADAKSWVLASSAKGRTLRPLLSADEHGIAVNSPMQVLVESDDTLLVLYSGAGGKPDGLLVRWSLATNAPVAQWPLAGVVDPMGMAFYPGDRTRLAVVDNNWALTEVLEGSLFEVELPSAGGDAHVTRLASGLRGPVSCAFGPDGNLYVAQLGERFDANLGQVLVVEGLK